MFENAAIPGNGGLKGYASQLQQIEKPIEQVSSINEASAKLLYEANGSLDYLLQKIRGAQPDSKEKGSQTSARHLLSDAYAIRDLANQIDSKLAELHRIIGHDK